MQCFHIIIAGFQIRINRRIVLLIFQFNCYFINSCFNISRLFIKKTIRPKTGYLIYKQFSFFFYDMP